MPHLQRPIRSHRRRVALAACAMLVAAGAAVGSAAAAQVAPSSVTVFPIAGGRVAAPSTQITFRGLPADHLGAISVTGSTSGAHPGRIVSDSDGDGASFIPAQSFKAGETVTVTTGLPIVGGNGGSYSFTVATPAGGIPLAGVRPVPRVRNDITRFVSRPDLARRVHRDEEGVPLWCSRRRRLVVAPQYGPIRTPHDHRAVWRPPLVPARAPQRHRHRLERPDLSGQAGADVVAG